MEVSFDVDVATEHGVPAAVIFNHIAALTQLPDGARTGYFKACGHTYVHVPPDYIWQIFPFITRRAAVTALRELVEGGLIVQRDYGGLDPDYRHWYTLTEAGEAGGDYVDGEAYR